LHVAHACDTAALTAFVEQGIPFNAFLGITVEELSPGYARLRLPFRPELIGDPRRPALHGGIFSTLLDTCGGTAVWTCCRPEDMIATIDMRVDYLRPGPEDDLVAEGRVRLLGNRVGNVSLAAWAAAAPDKILAEGRAVYNIRRSAKTIGAA
jgi:uncharacterized protein (TIGR00369 family)